jgi:hypothetical protein
MTCDHCGTEFLGNVKYFAHKVWKPINPQHHDPSNIVKFCSPDCSLDWYKKNRNKNEN